MIHGRPERWDRIADVVVVGSGGAAMTAATLAHDGGAEVLLVEKAERFGGTTGISGGVMWIPQNHHMAAAGVDDSREDAITYIRHLAKGQPYDVELIEAWVDAAPEALRYLEEHTPVEMQTVPNFPDYYFPYGIPGRRPGARSVEPVLYDAPRGARRVEGSPEQPRRRPPSRRRDDPRRGHVRAGPRHGERDRAPRNRGHPGQGRSADRSALPGTPRPRRDGPVLDPGPRARRRSG